jgi:hypothetical protein
MGVSSALGSSALLPAGLGFRNVLINGSMDIWQRGTSFAGTAGIVYSADRWFTYRAAGATGHTASRQTGPTNFQYCLRMQRNSGNTSTADIYLEQDVESANSYAFAGRQFVLSFWARAGSNYSSASSLLTAQVWTGTGTDQRIQSGFTGGATPGNSSVTLTTTWQQFYIYGVAAASTTQLGVRFGYTPVGTASTNDYFEVTGVQLEANYQPTPFEQLPIGVELALCQRYYYRIVSTAAFGRFGLGECLSTTAANLIVYLPVQLRAAPSATTDTTGTSSHYAVYSAGVITACNSLPAVATGGSNPNVVSVDLTVASGLTAGRAAQIIANNVTTAYIGLSAEL